MCNAAKIFTDYLNIKGVKYLVDGEDIVRITYTGENCPSITVNFIFDDEGRDVAIRSYSLAKVDKSDSVKYSKACQLCSTLNYEYRWIKFYLDKDDEITAADDAIIDPYTTGEECFKLLLRAIAIIDKSYPEVMKMLWG